MKSYLVVFFVLLSFVGFGQEEEALPEDYCNVYFATPEQSLTSFIPVTDFINFFPPEKMKANGIKTIIIKETDNDDIPTIHVDDYNFEKYILDANGYLIQKITHDYREIFVWNDDYTLHQCFTYREDTIDNSFTVFEYFENGKRLKTQSFFPNRNEESLEEFYLFDNQQGLSETQQEFGKNWSQRIKYNEDKLYAILETNILFDIETDTIFYNNRWQPTRYIQKYYFDNTYVQIITFQYDKNGQLTEEYKVYQENGETAYQMRTRYFYNNENLLDRTLAMNGGCEKSVHYYTE